MEPRVAVPVDGPTSVVPAEELERLVARRAASPRSTRAAVSGESRFTVSLLTPAPARRAG